jgi:Flp pilus assembly pilin Flp
MKLGKRLPILKLLKTQRGQTIVEFVLLLVVISGLSFGFVSVMNRNLGRYWEHCVNTIVNDSSTVKTLTID